MTRREWLAQATSHLEPSSFSARLDSEILLSFCLNIDRTHLLASVVDQLTVEQKATLNTLLERRARHEPIAYITGRKEFYGRDFLVTPDVLIPRPETEDLIERALLRVNPNDTVVDVGTGSGIIAITLKCERPESRVVATDISDRALEIAQKNSTYYECDISFYTTNLIDGISTCDIIIANLPYVATQQSTSLATRFEPQEALFGGDDGLNHYRRLFTQLERLKARPRVLLFEADPQQRHTLEQLAHAGGYRLRYHHQLIYEFELRESS